LKLLKQSSIKFADFFENTMLEIITQHLPPFAWNAFWISQILVFVAMITDIISWQCKKREIILVWLAISTLLIGTHFILLEAYVGAVMIYIATIRFITSIFSTNPRLVWLYHLLVLVGGFFTIKSGMGIIALVANLVFNYASFRPTDKRLRQWMMLGTSIWIVYNILIFTPMGIFIETVFLLSNVVGYYRYYIRKT